MRTVCYFLNSWFGIYIPGLSLQYHEKTWSVRKIKKLWNCLVENNHDPVCDMTN